MFSIILYIRWFVYLKKKELLYNEITVKELLNFVILPICYDLSNCDNIIQKYCIFLNEK